VIHWIAVGLSLLPGFAWLFFYAEEDWRREPARPMLRTFFFGGAFAFFALAFQLVLEKYLPASVALTAGTITIYAASEEFFKFLAAYVAVHRDPAFNEPLDAMLYCIIAALGFATLENIGAIAGQASLNPMLLTDVVGATTLRFAGATLLHTLATGTIGYYWARSILRGHKGWLLWGFFVGVAIHVTFNLLIFAIGSIAAAIAFVVVAGFFILYDYEELNNMRVNIRG
jgi:RsiW-degrading membrane proteinase PrsW (M82 family)